LLELWLIFSIITIICYGTAQQFSKKGVQVIGVFQTGILYAVAALVIQTSFRIFNPDDVTGDFTDIFIAIFAGATGALGFVFYVFALKSGKVSIVSVITAGYPAFAVLLALILLNEKLSFSKGGAVMLVVIGILLLSMPNREKNASEEKRPTSKKWLIWSFLALLLWGIWAIPSKVAMNNMGESDFIFIDGLTMVAVWVPLWLLFERGRLHRDFSKIKYSSTAGILASFGTVSLFLALNNGQVSIVTPLTSVYPLLTILLARIALNERLTPLQYLGIALAISGTILLAA